MRRFPFGAAAGGSVGGRIAAAHWAPGRRKEPRLRASPMLGGDRGFDHLGDIFFVAALQAT
jgi:hypothetical protein